MTAEFDEYGDPLAYDSALKQGISISGEYTSYFARGRVAWVAARLNKLGARPGLVLDFGCGSGSATPFLLEELGAERVVGIDPSARFIHTARRLHESPRATFCTIDAYEPDGGVDLVFCNGVFHHIPPADRPASLALIARAMRPGGLFSLWENNPWNPGTRIVMKRIPFDRDAITLTPPEARGLLTSAGFEVLRTDFLFIFPRMLAFLRGLEPPLSRYPLGAQYLVLARLPGVGDKPTRV